MRVCIKICSSDWSSIWTKTYNNYISAICFHCVRRHDGIMSLQKHFYYRRPTHFILSNHPFLYYWIFCTDSNVWAWIYNSQYMHICDMLFYIDSSLDATVCISCSILLHLKKEYVNLLSFNNALHRKHTCERRWRKAKQLSNISLYNYD